MSQTFQIQNRQCVVGEHVMATAKRDIMLYELSQVMLRLHQSNQPEPICGRIGQALSSFEELGLISIAAPNEPGEPVTVARLCPPSMLLHYFWGAWLPAFYRGIDVVDVREEIEFSRCTVVLELPHSRKNLHEVLVDLSLRLEVSGVAAIKHIERGDTAIQECRT